MRLLITGAAGSIGALVRPRLARPDRVLRLLDLRPVPDPAAGEETVIGSFTDPATMAAACVEVDAIVHLGGISREDTWERVLAVNIDGARTVLEAARRAGVSRVVLASSNHAVGFAPVGPEPIAAEALPRPDTYYGVSKAATEALGALYHHRFGMDVLCVRIGHCAERPSNLRDLSLWLSPDDCAHLLDTCLTVKDPGYRLIWGVSANTRAAASLREARAIGYRSADNAERFAPDIDTASSNMPPFIGGLFCETPLGVPNPQ
ncbi:NAD(P)-dependent oxidoreductase [Nocardia panacis]|uniref:NAD(P)-dependent oxidoreductase n=1 Tax=Nocardia panacis TaxID=2340916 RepID=A0A3A4K7Y3_9NOCA|nr:NAD(P)-dependent oxidoreductase [Nocardia panacis]RJO73642.1 NAD(P)-dependent oxidoreductase [Nocardia panacis]